MNQNHFEHNSNYSGFDQSPQYSIDHQEDLNPQRISDVHVRWDKIEESLLNMMQSFYEMVIQQKQAASIDQSPLQKMSIQDMEDLKQHYLVKMLSLSNDLQIKDYRNEKIGICFRRECESMIDELKVAIIPDLPTMDSLIMGDEHLSTIPEKESDEVVKSSVEDLVPIPS
ncbi:hypothetical protein Tco_0888127 [Tanacetum coccineum]